MGDIARRRELRKRRILENSELRKQKIFGLYSNAKDNSFNDIKSDSAQTQRLKVDSSKFAASDDVDETGSTKSLESEVSSKSFNNDSSTDYADVNKLSEVLKNIPDPSVESEEYMTNNEIIHEFCDRETLENAFVEQSRSHNNIVSDKNLVTSTANSSSPQTSTLHTSGGGSLLSNANDRPFIPTTPNYFWCWLEHPAAPSLLGLIVLLLLSLDLGNLVSNSFIIPFCVWEIQQVIASYTFPEVKEEQSSVIEAALLLCGIHKNIITRYIWISKLLKDILEDFAIYIITIVVLQAFTGFPAAEAKG